MKCLLDFGIGENKLGINWDEIYSKTLKLLEKKPKEYTNFRNNVETSKKEKQNSNPFELTGEAREKFESEVAKIYAKPDGKVKQEETVDLEEEKLH